MALLAGISSLTCKIVSPTRILSPSWSFTSGYVRWAACSGVSALSRLPFVDPLTQVPLRLPKSRTIASGGFASRMKWCREAVVSASGIWMWQSEARPKMKVSCSSNDEVFALHRAFEDVEFDFCAHGCFFLCHPSSPICFAAHSSILFRSALPVRLSSSRNKPIAVRTSSFASLGFPNLAEDTLRGRP